MLLLLQLLARAVAVSIRRTHPLIMLKMTVLASRETYIPVRVIMLRLLGS